ncbi:MAG: hypothetical protein ACLFTW_06935, partial [Chitinispirillaceae bacterium]
HSCFRRGGAKFEDSMAPGEDRRKHSFASDWGGSASRSFPLGFTAVHPTNTTFTEYIAFPHFQ